MLHHISVAQYQCSATSVSLASEHTCTTQHYFIGLESGERTTVTNIHKGGGEGGKRGGEKGGGEGGVKATPSLHQEMV